MIWVRGSFFATPCNHARHARCAIGNRIDIETRALQLERMITMHPTFPKVWCLWSASLADRFCKATVAQATPRTALFAEPGCVPAVLDEALSLDWKARCSASVLATA